MVRSGFRSIAIVVVVFAAAMAYLESTVVVYLHRALGIAPDALFPLRDPRAVADLATIEVGRELATLVMLAAIGWIAGRSAPERLAWAAVAFGTWDVGYYGWLLVISGWPSSLETWDLLFLFPVPWVGPVWAPLTVSVALIGFGLAAARRYRAGGTIPIGPRRAAAGAAGGALVIASFTLDTGRIMGGGVPTSFPWPIFAAGMLVAIAAAVSALWQPSGSISR
ncbi:MAG: hypothetical protein A2X23_04850 [Chloroflexi bacterium GWC2_73_18]|nr:MAG: hypothetical protein A2X23_04850 [Chloroflexi bacterium GWC2_73_18]